MDPGRCQEGDWRPKFDRRRKKGARVGRSRDFGSDFGFMLEVILGSFLILFRMFFGICFGMDSGVVFNSFWSYFWLLFGDGTRLLNRSISESLIFKVRRVAAEVKILDFSAIFEVFWNRF